MVINSRKNNQLPKGAIVIYKEKSGKAQFKVKLEQETVWLTQKQMAELFNKDIRTINEHINNIFAEQELPRGSVIRKFRTTATDGKKYLTNFYNLDVIISVGYRIKSKQGTQFRIWATKVLRNHIIKGYTVNQKRLKQQRRVRLSELQRTIVLLQGVVQRRNLESNETVGLLKVITDYANTWALLESYDKNLFKIDKTTKRKAKSFNIIETGNFISELKKNLAKKREASRFFGVERDDGLVGILGNLNQAIAGKAVYKSIEEKAAHLLYFVIKDRVFIDGNKRIAAFLFVLFLARNDCLFNKKGEKKINDNALASLALLIAESKAQDKDIMVALIINLLKK